MARCLSVIIAIVLLIAAVTAQSCNVLNIQSPKTIWPSDPMNTQFNGHYVKTYGPRTVAGAYGHNAWEGIIYVNRLDGGNYVQEAALSAPDGARGAYLGLNVDMNDQFIIGGAPYAEINHDGSRFVAGKAYIWQRNTNNTWSLVNTLQAPDPNPAMRFGYSVAISDEFVFIGARFAHNRAAGANRAGALYVYKGAKSALQLVQTLRGNSPGAHWADEVVYANGVLGVGAPRKNRGEGAAYVFELQSDRTFSQTGYLLHEPPAGVVKHRNDHISEGIDVAPNGSYIVLAGERARSPGCTHGGAAYVFRKDSSGQWEQRASFFPSNCGDNRFGQRLSTANNKIVVGAWNELNGSGNKAGSVYVYSLCEDGAWLMTDKILNPIGNDLDEFGKCVHMDYNKIVVGCPQCDRGAQVDAGAVFVYDYSQGGLQQVDRVAERYPKMLMKGTYVKVWVTYTVTQPNMQMLVHVRDMNNTQRLAGGVNQNLIVGGIRKTPISFRLPDTFDHNTPVILRTDIRPIGGGFAQHVATTSSFHTIIDPRAYVRIARLPARITAGRNFDVLCEYSRPRWMPQAVIILEVYVPQTGYVLRRLTYSDLTTDTVSYRTIRSSVGYYWRGKTVAIRFGLRRTPSDPNFLKVVTSSHFTVS